ncbi:uncharacterized protein B0H18DRAFT_1125480 [Fomitopsis serialis]|uniref:uncharacterized protein n=1 Tax=Fomitopsis serialis TaxID=139415 RepID=UPI0020072E63|nr:uncharacterized protein B0H18DRAFT_1125480 [Neoantrodia serialis]KAH9914551.1 hypothetical protein B0H18DRAFT_1125480 [Neoantrodia serialis]
MDSSDEEAEAGDAVNRDADADSSEESEEEDERDQQYQFIPLPDPSQPVASTSSAPAPARRTALSLDEDDDERVEDIDRSAGKVIGTAETIRESWREHFNSLGGQGHSDEDVLARVNAVWAPFESEMDWQITKWFVKEGIGQGAVDRFLRIPEVQERLGLTYHNNRALLQKVDSIPERLSWKECWLTFKDRPGEHHLVQYHDIIEAIKALLGNPAHANQIVYRPSHIFSNSARTNRIYTEMWTGQWWHAIQSILPAGTAVDSAGITENKRRVLVQQLFHASVRTILQPLVDAGKEGIDVTGGDGNVRRVHPILASYVADYPEQCLVSCTKYGTCPICQCPESGLGDASAKTPRAQLWTLDVLRKARQQGERGSTAFSKSCKQFNVSGYCIKPFWRDYRVFTHIVEWSTELIGEKELDRRIRCLPPAYGTRHFKTGISALSQVSGSERKDIARILLRCLVGRIPRAAMLTFRSLLNFIYLSQYPTHDESTLGYMEDALKMFHDNKHILEELGVREHLNIPKVHSLLHYVDSIRRLGMTDNFNTEMFERLHIDCAKKAWRVSNHRNARPQMIKWLDRREKFSMYDTLRGRLSTDQSADPQAVSASESTTGTANSEDDSTHLPRSSKTRIKLAKHPSLAQQSLPSIEEQHAAPGFTDAVSQYVYTMKLQRRLRPREQDRANRHLPFGRVDVFHGFKFNNIPLNDNAEEKDGVKARPSSADKPARFDTVVVLRSDEAEATGLQGTRVGRLRVIFQLPKTIRDPTTNLDMEAPEEWAQEGPLAYVEWYGKLGSMANPVHMMYDYVGFFRADVNKSKVHSTKLEEDGLVYCGYKNTMDFSHFPPPPIQRRAACRVVIEVPSDSEDDEARSNGASSSSTVTPTVAKRAARQTTLSLVPASGARRTRRTVGGTGHTGVPGTHGPIAQYHEHSRYYSAIKPWPNKIVENGLPIEMPVYKESLETTYARQGDASMILVNDDGLRLLSVEERDTRIAFYANHGIGWVARPKLDDAPDGSSVRTSAAPEEDSLGHEAEQCYGMQYQHWDGSNASVVGFEDDEKMNSEGSTRCRLPSTRCTSRAAASSAPGPLTDVGTCVPCWRDHPDRQLGHVGVIQHESDIMQVAHHCFAYFTGVSTNLGGVAPGPNREGDPLVPLVALLHYKFSMMSYMFSYYGIACSITISVINYICLGFELPVDGYYMHSYRLGEEPLIKSFLINVMWIPYFFFFGGLSIPVSQAIIAHLFSHNISWGAKKEVKRSIFFEDIPKILKRFWVPWTICIVLTAGLIILSTSLVPVQWRIDGGKKHARCITRCSPTPTVPDIPRSGSSGEWDRIGTERGVDGGQTEKSRATFSSSSMSGHRDVDARAESWAG